MRSVVSIENWLFGEAWSSYRDDGFGVEQMRFGSRKRGSIENDILKDDEMKLNVDV